jgi:DNA-binding XRE family transcriptional regulator
MVLVMGSVIAVGPAPGQPPGKIYQRPVAPRLTLAIRDQEWRRLCAERALYNDSLLGAELGVSVTTVWRVRTRHAAPGIQFALQAMRVFEVPFEALFEVSAVTDDVVAA